MNIDKIIHQQSHFAWNIYLSGMSEHNQSAK